MLTGQQIAQLRNALLDAYPTHAALREMVLEELNENLDAIAGGETLRSVVFSLITWAESTGRTLELVEGAYRHNDANPALREVAAAHGVAVSPQPPASAPAPTPLPAVAALILEEKEATLRMLTDQYRAANQQLRTELNAANRPLLEEQVRLLETKMQAVQQEIDRLKS